MRTCTDHVNVATRPMQTTGTLWSPNAIPYRQTVSYKDIDSDAKAGSQTTIDAKWSCRGGRNHEAWPFIEGSSSSPMSSADGTAAEFAAPAATAEFPCGGATSLQQRDYTQSQHLCLVCSHPSLAKVVHRGGQKNETHHLIWNLVTRGFVLISRTKRSKRIGSGSASFISSLSYSVFW